MKGRPKNYLPDAARKDIADLFNKGVDVDGEVLVVSRDQVDQADFDLSPSKWVGQTEAADHRSLSELIESMGSLARRVIAFGRQ